MQGINQTAVRPPLMIALFGTALGSAAVAVMAFRRAHATTRTLLLGGAGLYLVGAVGVTIAYNVPLNDELAAVGVGTAEQWQHYLTRWTAGNHVRTISSLAAAACLAAALKRT